MAPDAPKNLVRYIPAPDAGAGDLPAEARAVLEEVNQRIAGRQSIQQIIDYLFEQTAGLAEADRLSVAFTGEDDRRIVSYYTRTAYEPVRLKAGYAEDLAGSSLGEVIHRGAVRLIDDLPAYGRARPESRSTQLLLAEGVQSSMTCPLAVDGRNVGVLFRSSRRGGAYREADVAVHYAVAERLGQAVEKAYRIEQLAAANRAYGEMLSFVAHELKSPLSGMIGQAQLLQEGYLGETNDRQHKAAGKIIDQGLYLSRLVSDYLNLARIERGELRPQFQPLDDFVQQVIDPAWSSLADRAAERDLDLAIDAAPRPLEAQCDAQLMRIVMANYLSNAIKYGREGGRIDVRAGIDQAGRLRVAVRNEGPGFAPEHRSELFKKFSRLDEPQLKQQKGTGVGLYSCWRVVNLHGGRVDARSEPGRWAEFSFTLPQPPGV